MKMLRILQIAGYVAALSALIVMGMEIFIFDAESLTTITATAHITLAGWIAGIAGTAGIAALRQRSTNQK